MVDISKEIHILSSTVDISFAHTLENGIYQTDSKSQGIHYLDPNW